MNVTRKHRRYAGTALAAALTLAVTFGAPARLDAASVRTSANQDALVMAVGGSRVVNPPAEMSEVCIANTEVVDVHVRPKPQHYIIAQAPGETNSSAHGKTGKNT